MPNVCPHDMKTLLSLSLLLLGARVHAVWAKHDVLRPDTLTEYAGHAPTLTRLPDGKIHIHLPPSPQKPKVYQLVVCKAPRAADKLDFRYDSGLWKLRTPELRALQPDEARLADIEDIRLLASSDESGAVELTLPPEVAARAYITWDFGNGYLVMDGGLWLTYDLPAFVEALPKLGNP